MVITANPAKGTVNAPEIATLQLHTITLQLQLHTLHGKEQGQYEPISIFHGEGKTGKEDCS